MVESAPSPRTSVELLEREFELSALASVLDAAVAGAGSLAIVDGAAGLGKTTLLSEVRARARDRGVRVMAARGGELEQTFPFGVVRQLFEPTVARLHGEELDAAFDGAAALAGPLFGIADATRTAGDDEGGFAVLHGLYWLTVNLAERQPLLLAVDDLHWADAASLRWIAYLAHRIDGLPVAVVATVRPLEADADPALADLVADPAALSVRPAPLTLAAATAIVAERLPRAPLGEVAAACHEVTGGNPLLLRELLAALASARPPDEPHELIAEVRRLAPEVVSRRVKLELAKLGSDAAQLANAVAVLGDDVELRHAAELARLDDTPAREVVGRLVRAELLGRDRLLRFVHPLLRSAVYDAIPAAEREDAHGRAAAVLAAAAVSIERVAAQVIAAPPAASAEAVRTLRDAAAHAMADGASESAVAHLRRALDEPPAPSERADVLLELAAAEARIGSPDSRARLLEALRLLDDAPRRAQVRLELARGLFWVAQEEEAVAEIERAIAEDDRADPAFGRLIEAEYVASALRVPALHDEAIGRLDAFDVGDADDAGARMLLALQAYALAFRGRELERAVALAERALSRGLPSDEAPSWSHWGAVSALLYADRFDAALGVVDEALADARRRGAVYLFSGASLVRGSIHQARGSLAEAEADARAAVDALPHRGAMITPLAYGVLAQVLVERGQLDPAVDLLGEAGADGHLPETFGAIPLIRARGLLRLAQGDPRAALADALACGRAFDAVGFHNPAGVPWRSDAALAHVAAGQAAEARRLAGAELELARRWGAPRPVGRALRVLGLAEGGDTGLATLRDSVLALEDSPAQLERAHSLIELGSALRRALKRIEARDRLRAGLELAQRCAAAALAEHARDELVAAGAKPRATALSGAGSLTPSEHRVAGMASEGMTNRQIAQALFVTPRTVEMHLSNAFRKLQIGSRTQLAEALAS